jgi:hypothetical protein
METKRNKIDISDYLTIKDEQIQKPEISPSTNDIPISNCANPFESDPLYKRIKEYLLDDGFSFGDFGLVQAFTEEEVKYNTEMSKLKLVKKNLLDENSITNSAKGFCGEYATIKLFKCISEALGVDPKVFKKIIPPISVYKNDSGQDIKVGGGIYSIKSRKDTHWARTTSSSDIFKIGPYSVLWTFVDNDYSKYKLIRTSDESNVFFANFECLKHLTAHFIKHMTEAVERLRNENTQA